MIGTPAASRGRFFSVAVSRLALIPCAAEASVPIARAQAMRIRPRRQRQCSDRLSNSGRVRFQVVPRRVHCVWRAWHSGLGGARRRRRRQPEHEPARRPVTPRYHKAEQLIARARPVAPQVGRQLDVSTLSRDSAALVRLRSRVPVGRASLPAGACGSASLYTGTVQAPCALRRASAARGFEKCRPTGLCAQADTGATAVEPASPPRSCRASAHVLSQRAPRILRHWSLQPDVVKQAHSLQLRELFVSTARNPDIALLHESLSSKANLRVERHRARRFNGSGVITKCVSTRNIQNVCERLW